MQTLRGVVLVCALAACGDSTDVPEPRLLLSTPAAITSLAHSDTDVFVTVRFEGMPGFGVYRGSKHSDDASTLYQEASYQGDVEIIGIDDSSVYWRQWDGTAGTVRAVGFDGVVRELVRAERLYTAALDTNEVYFAIDVPEGLTRIRKVPKAGGSVDDVAILDVRTPLAIVARDTTLYSLHGAQNSGRGSIWQTPKSGGTPERLVADIEPLVETSDDVSSPLLTDGMHLYWFDRGRSDIERVTVTGGAVESVGAHQECADRATITNRTLYMGCSHNWPIIAIDLETGARSLLVDRRIDARGLVADETAVYWADRSHIWALPR